MISPLKLVRTLFFFTLFYSIFLSFSCVINCLKKSRDFKCHRGWTLPLTNPRSCYCKQKLACVCMWTERSDTLSDSSERLTCTESLWLELADVNGLYMCERMRGGWKHMSLPLATAVSVFVSFSEKYLQGTSNSHPCTNHWDWQKVVHSFIGKILLKGDALNSDSGSSLTRLMRSGGPCLNTLVGCWKHPDL